MNTGDAATSTHAPRSDDDITVRGLGVPGGGHGVGDEALRLCGLAGAAASALATPRMRLLLGLQQGRHFGKRGGLFNPVGKPLSATRSGDVIGKGVLPTRHDPPPWVHVSAGQIPPRLGAGRV